MNTYLLWKYWENPVRTLKRKSFTMVMSLLHHGTSPHSSQKAKTFKYLSVILTTMILSQFLKNEQEDKRIPERFHERSQIFEQPKDPLSCDYYDFKKLKTNKQDLSILHLNISFISANIHGLRAFLNLVNHKFDIICISQSTKHKAPTINQYALTRFQYWVKSNWILWWMDYHEWYHCFKKAQSRWRGLIFR